MGTTCAKTHARIHAHFQFLTYTNTILPLPLSLSFCVCLGLSAHDRVLCVPLNHCNTHTLAQGYKKRRGRQGKWPKMRGCRRKDERGKDLLPNSLQFFFTFINRGSRASSHHEVRGNLTVLEGMDDQETFQVIFP